VLTERKVSRPIFSDPKTWSKKVVVNSSQTTSVSFVISDK